MVAFTPDAELSGHTKMTAIRARDERVLLRKAWTVGGASTYVFHDDPSSDAHFELRGSASIGVGAYAFGLLRAGTRLLAESPLLELALQHVCEERISAAASQLSFRAQREFNDLCMHGVVDDREKTGMGRWLSNAYPTDEDPEEFGAVFRVACKFNHSCRPNARITWNARMRKMTIHTLADVAAGAEIHVCYAMELLEGGGCREMRQATLHERFGFTCACALCQLDLCSPALTASDERRARLQQLAGDIVDCQGNVPALVLARLELLRAEGLAPSVESMAVAHAYAQFTGDQDGAQNWARLAEESARMQLGDDSDDCLKWTDDYLKLASSSSRGGAAAGDRAAPLMIALATFCLRTGQALPVNKQTAEADEQLAAMEARLRAAEAELAELERMDAQMAART